MNCKSRGRAYGPSGGPSVRKIRRTPFGAFYTTPLTRQIEKVGRSLTYSCPCSQLIGVHFATIEDDVLDQARKCLKLHFDIVDRPFLVDGLHVDNGQFVVLKIPFVDEISSIVTSSIGEASFKIEFNRLTSTPLFAGEQCFSHSTLPFATPRHSAVRHGGCVRHPWPRRIFSPVQASPGPPNSAG